MQRGDIRDISLEVVALTWILVAGRVHCYSWDRKERDIATNKVKVWRWKFLAGWWW